MATAQRRRLARISLSIHRPNEYTTWRPRLSGFGMDTWGEWKWGVFRVVWETVVPIPGVCNCGPDGLERMFHLGSCPMKARV